MKSIPEDPMRQHNRLIAAFCDDLFDMVVHKTTGTPRADAVVHLTRQTKEAKRDRQAD